MDVRNVRDFGAAGDGTTDDTSSIQHAIDAGAQLVVFPPGDYLVSQPIHIDMQKVGRLGVSGAGGTAKIIMSGAGPAFRITGSHDASADPSDFGPEFWHRERMPTIEAIEIEGRHDDADGIYLEGTMQSTFTGVLIRKMRHGIHVYRRARNVLISHCHIYDNRGIGVFFDHANLHQAIIASSHISFNRQCGIKILNGQVRNIQITGNDIEYNFRKDNPGCADIWIETTGDATIREGTIASNTIQSRYSGGGANIMMIGSEDEAHRTGMWTIAGNLIGSQETNVRLVGCRGITLTGNFMYSGHLRNLHVLNSRNIVATGNSFDHNPDYLPRELATGITFENSQDCTLSGSIIQDAYAGHHTVQSPATLERRALVEILDCARLTVSGCNIIDGAPHGVFVKDSTAVNIHGCTILDSRDEPKMTEAIHWEGDCPQREVNGCILG